MLLLHGFPETRRCWDAVVERMAPSFTLVRSDLPGYGDSPPSRAGHSKRTMASSVLQLTRALGHERFAVAGHDRGGLVGQRVALDHPEAVNHLAVLDIIPLVDMWESISADSALPAYHLIFLAQESDLPERMINCAPEAFVDSFLDGWSVVQGAISDNARKAYHRAAARPGRARAICEDYRAGATVDLEDDRSDRAAGRRIAAPVLALWQEPDGAPAPFDVLSVWRLWARSVVGSGLNCGHYLPEERPAEVAAALASHFATR